MWFAGSAVSFAMVTHWVCNFAIGQLFLPATAKFGISQVYLGFAGVCILAALFVQTAVLETKVGRAVSQTLHHSPCGPHSEARVSSAESRIYSTAILLLM